MAFDESRLTISGYSAGGEASVRLAFATIYNGSPLAADAKAMERIVIETARSAFGETKFKMRATDPKTGQSRIIEIGLKSKS